MNKARNVLLKLILISLFISFPTFLYAAVSITEIMYDPAGTDDGHEWIEVYNSGESFDLSKWKLFEGGSNHGISAYAGGSNLATGGYAVLADNPQKFLADWPNFSGIVFDSVFSGGLNNTNGETMTLRNDSAVDVDSVTYNPTLGANGDGNSLQKIGSSFIASAPTPGSASGSGSGSSSATETENQKEEEESSSSSSVASTTPTSTGGSYPVEPQISVSAGENRVVVAGAGTVFQGSVRGLKGDSIRDARLVWNFGNGDVREGYSVLYAFPFPGRYAVVLDASSETYSATARFTVTVVPAHVSLTKVTQEFVEITNASGIELNVGLWLLAADGKTFRFPANTILFPRESVSISNVATGLAPSSPSAVTLLYPNGTLATAYGTELIAARGVASQEASQVERVSVPSEAVTSVSSRSMLAAPIAALGSTSMPILSSFAMLPWIIGLLAVIGIGIAAALLIRPRKGTTTGYTIIEEE